MTAAATITTTIRVPDMHCANCAGKVRRALERNDGVLDLRFNTVRRHVLVDHTDAVEPATLLSRIEQAGFHPALGGGDLEASAHSRDLLIRFGVAAFCMMQVMMVTIGLYAGVFEGIDVAWRRLLEYSALLFSIPVVTFCAAPFFRTALAAAVSTTAGQRAGLGMDTTIALAVGLAFAVSLWNTLDGSGEVYFDAVTMFTCLMLGTRYLDARLRDRLASGDRLTTALPREVLRVVNGVQTPAPVAFVQAGDVLIIREGEMLCVDGELQSESALLDESSLTGESVWRTISAGAAVHAGTWNRGPALQMVARGDVDASRIARIDAMTEAAMTTKGRIATLTDRVSGVFVPAILSLAAAAALFWWLFDADRMLPAALAVLVVSCPCALALAAPAALHAAVSRLRQAGILVRNAAALERVAGITDVVFDKTGTLTRPDHVIVRADAYSGFTGPAILRLAGILQQHVSHPLARAFPPVPDGFAARVEIVPGCGVTGDVDGQRVTVGTASFCGADSNHTAPGHTTDSTSSADNPGEKPVWIAIDGQLAGRFTLRTQLRDDASATIDALRALGIDVSMRSGDRDEHCAGIAKVLGIDYVAGQTPEAKAEAITDRSKTTLFVGDGLNDMPALATAAVSVVTLETTDLVKSKADAILLQPRLGALVDLIVTGRRSQQVVHQNLGWALLYNAIAIPLAMAAIAPPWSAALGMSLSSLIVLLNAATILRSPIHGHGSTRPSTRVM